jgi:excisionase family DNA binding protein
MMKRRRYQTVAVPRRRSGKLQPLDDSLDRRSRDLSRDQAGEVVEPIAESDGTLLMSVTAAARLLGISRSMAYQWIASGTLPHCYLGPSRLLRVPRAALDSWIAGQTLGG